MQAQVYLGCKGQLEPRERYFWALATSGKFSLVLDTHSKVCCFLWG